MVIHLFRRLYTAKFAYWAANIMAPYCTTMLWPNNSNYYLTAFFFESPNNMVSALLGRTYLR